jgi:hypothetical protein
MQDKIIIGVKFAAVLASAFAQLRLAVRFSLEATSALGRGTKPLARYEWLGSASVGE